VSREEESRAAKEGGRKEEGTQCSLEIILERDCLEANSESSEVVDILLPVTFYFDPSTRLDNVKNL